MVCLWRKEIVYWHNESVTKEENTVEHLILVALNFGIQVH